jgi:8-oxo-dGTP diphosphatase
MIKCRFEDNNEASLRHVTVDSLLINDGKLLLVKRTGKLLEGGKWGLVGGFVDRDETLKEAVAREAKEETGYLVSNIRLLTVRDNPDRPKEDRQNISFIYICDVGDKVGESDWEVDDQKWFDLDDLPKEEEIAFDHYSNIELYKRYLSEKFGLPVI